MNSLNIPVKIISGNDFIPSLMSFLEGDIIIADHSVLIMFDSLEVPIENKVNFARLILERNLLIDLSSKDYLENFITENSLHEIHSSVFEKISSKIKKILKIS